MHKVLQGEYLVIRLFKFVLFLSTAKSKDKDCETFFVSDVMFYK